MAKLLFDHIEFLSLVDRPANGEKFHVTKRKTDDGEDSPEDFGGESDAETLNGVLKSMSNENEEEEQKERLIERIAKKAAQEAAEKVETERAESSDPSESSEQSEGSESSEGSDVSNSDILDALEALGETEESESEGETEESEDEIEEVTTEDILEAVREIKEPDQETKRENVRKGQGNPGNPDGSGGGFSSSFVSDAVSGGDD